MEIKKYKVYNNNNFNVGINFENEHNKTLLIPKNNFRHMTEDELMYVNSASKLLSDGVLYVEEQDILEKLGILEKNPNALSTQEIEAIFKLPVNKMKKELEKISKKHAIDKIVAYCKTADLSSSKLRVVKDLYNIDIFEEIAEEIV